MSVAGRLEKAVKCLAGEGGFHTFVKLNMCEAELCKEILAHAYRSRTSFPLLHALSSYDSVLAAHGMSPDSPVATNVYRTLLRWGRDQRLDWWKRYEEEFAPKEKGLTVQDLEGGEGSVGKTAGESYAFKAAGSSSDSLAKAELQSFSFGLRPSDELRTQKFALAPPSPPTKDSPLSHFAFSLPQFREFLRRTKTPSDSQLIAIAFRVTAMQDQRLKSSAFYAFRVYVEANAHHHFQEKVADALSTKTRASLVTKAWQIAASDSKQERTASAHWRTLIGKKAIDAWTQHSLLKFKSRLSKALARKYVCQRHFRYWKRAREAGKVRSGLIFTAEFIHKQWLVKKALLGLGKNLQEELRLKIFEKKLSISHSAALKRLHFALWQTYCISKSANKQLYLRGYQESYHLGLKLGWRKLRMGVKQWTLERSLMQRAVKFHSQLEFKALGTFAISSFRRFVARRNGGKAAKGQYQRSLRVLLFTFFSDFANSERTRSNAILRAMEIRKKTAVSSAWKALTNQRKQVLESLNPLFVYCSYRWLLAYCERARAVFSPSSTSSLSTDRKADVKYELPAAFQRDAGTLKSAATVAAESCMKSFIAQRVWKQWRKNAKSFHRKKRQFREKALKPLFLAWRSCIHSSLWRRFQLTKYLSRKQSCQLLVIVLKWRKLAAVRKEVRKVYKETSEMKASEHLNRSWVHWRTLYLTVVKRRSETRLSANLFKSKYLGQTLQTWRNRLAARQRKKHLVHTCEKFSFQRLLTAHWRKWRSRFIATIELNITSEQIISTKEAVKVGKVLAAWQRLVPVLRRESYQRQMAGVKYNRKLAKRAVTALLSYAAYARHKHSVYDAARSRCRVVVMRNCLLALQFYAEFRAKLREKDQARVPKVRKMMKALRFRQWYCRALLYSSCRYLPEMMVKLQKRHFFRRLEINKDAQRLTDAYIRLHQEKALQLQVLSAWRQYVQKKATLDEYERRFRIRDRHFRRLAPFRAWRRAFCYERNIGKIGYIAVIRIKNDILREVLRAWKLYRGYRLRKKYSRTHRENVLQKQTFTAWHRIRTKKDRLKRIATAAGKHLAKQNVSRVFYTWLTAAIRKQKCWYNYREVVRNRVRRALNEWKKELGWRERKSALIEKAESLRDTFRVKRAMRKLRQNSKHQTTISKVSSLAESHYSAKLTRSAFQALSNHFQLRKNLSRARNTTLANCAKRGLSRHFSAWKLAAEPAIKRAKSAHVIATISGKTTLRWAMKSWLRSIHQQREIEEKAQNHYRHTLKSTAFSVIRNFLKSQASKRIRTTEITKMRNQLKAKSAFRCLESNIFRSKTAKSQQERADTYHFQRLEKLSIVAWLKYVALSQDLRGKSTAADLFYMEKTAPVVLEAWKAQSQRLRQKRVLVETAYRHYAITALHKSLKAVKSYKSAVTAKLEKQHFAKAQYQATLKAKYFGNLRTYRSARVTEKGRQSHFTFQLSEKWSRNVMGKAFAALRENALRSAMKIADIGQLRTVLTAKTAISTWKSVWESRSEERQIAAGISKSVQKRTKKWLFQYWRKQRGEVFALKKLKLKLKRKMLHRNLTEWRRQLALRFMDMRKEFSYKLAAFQTLLKYSQLSLQAQKLFRLVGSQLETAFAKRLLQKWRKTHHNDKKTAVVQQRQKLRKAEIAFKQWKKWIEVRNKVVHFQQNIETQTMAKTLRHWQQQQVRHSSQYSTLSGLVKSTNKRWKLTTFQQWKSVARYESIWNNVVRLIIEPRNVRKISTAFLGWKLMFEQRKMLLKVSSRYIEGRCYLRKRAIFDALASARNRYIQAEKVLTSKERNQNMRNKKRILRAWKLLVKTKTTLSALRDMIARKAQHRYQRVFLRLWISESQKKAAVKSMQRQLLLSLKARCYGVWRKRFVEKTNQSLFARVLILHGKKAMEAAIGSWRKEVMAQRDLDRKVQSFLTQHETRLKKSALHLLSSAATREKRYLSSDLRLKINRAKRVLRLFSLGCHISREQAVNTHCAVEHRSKRLMLVALVAWRVWMQQRFEAHVEADSDYLRAHQHRCSQLLRKAFGGWASQTRETAYIQQRSRSYAIFSAWKVHTREMALLKKYLQECNLSERYIRSSRDVHDSSRSSVFATLRSLGSSGTTTRELTELSAERSQT